MRAAASAARIIEENKRINAQPPVLLPQFPVTKETCVKEADVGADYERKEVRSEKIGWFVKLRPGGPRGSKPHCAELPQFRTKRLQARQGSNLGSRASRK